MRVSARPRAALPMLLLPGLLTVCDHEPAHPPPTPSAQGTQPAGPGTTIASAGAAGGRGDAEDAEGSCPTYSGPHRLGTAPSMGLPEASGLAASPRHPGHWWTHNDSGAGPVMHLLDPTGARRLRLRLAGIGARDWEDMASVVDAEGRAWIYVADMGDNLSIHPQIEIHRFLEPDLPAGRRASLRPETVSLRYPDGPHDAEALIVDPLTLELLIVTKERRGHSQIFRSEDPFAAPHEGAPIELELAGSVTLGHPALPGSELVTAGDLRADGRALILRTYSTACLYERRPGQPLAETLTGPCCSVPLAPEPQGEAIAFLRDGSGYATISEGHASPIWRFDLVD